MSRSQLKTGRLERRRKTEDGLLEIRKENSSPPQDYFVCVRIVVLNMLLLQFSCSNLSGSY